MAPDDFRRLRHDLSVRYSTDSSWKRFGPVVLAGSPLRLFRTTAAAAYVLAAIESGSDVADSRLTDRLVDAGAIHPLPGSNSAGPQFTIGDVTIVTPQFGGLAQPDGRMTIDDGSQPPIRGASIRLDTNRGPAAARNAASEHITTALIAFVDADVTFDNEWLEPLLGHFGDSQVGLVAPRVRGERGSPLDLGNEPARIRSGSRVSYVPGAALLVRKSALDAVGWFDEALRFGEDVDLVWRLDDAGWRCRYEPRSTVWHRPRSTWAERLRQHASYGTSAAPLALRHQRSLAPIRMNMWSAIAWSMLASGHPLRAGLTATMSSLALIPKLSDIPPSAALGLALRGHFFAGRQITDAVRRNWWPIVFAAAVFSRRMRWIAVISILADLRSTPTDIAYGYGVWSGMRRYREWTPIMPRINSWPGDTQRSAR